MTLAQEVAQLLHSAPVNRINFRCGPTRVWGKGYRHVAAAILRPWVPGTVGSGHRIVVEGGNRLFTAAGCGNYSESLGPNRMNKMLLPYTSMQTVQHCATAVHEATHALQDWVSRPMSQADSECAAYIAHMMYAHIATGGQFPFSVGQNGLDLDAFDLFSKSWDAARRILTQPGAYAVTAREQRDIKTALRRLRPYRHADRVQVAYDGI